MNPRTVNAHPRVSVLGGVNVDTFLRVRTLPSPGETVLGTGLFSALGGKAANQAVAIARAAVPVTLLAAIGSDAEGTRMSESLADAGVDVGGLLRLDQVPTGRATILVDEAGQNVIVVTPAANGLLTPEHVAGWSERIARSSALVVQGEVPVPATLAATRLAAESGVRVIVNLAPYTELGEAVAFADPVVVNEVEASQLLGRAVTGAGSADAVGGLARVARSAVVTVGAEGALVVAPDGRVDHVPAPAVTEVVDTTGAGDAFVGVLAAALARGFGLDAAVRHATRAATASVRVLGAGVNYPVFDLDDPVTGLREEAIAG